MTVFSTGLLFWFFFDGLRRGAEVRGEALFDRLVALLEGD